MKIYFASILYSATLVLSQKDKKLRSRGLGECDFDCDTDSDCRPGLLCADEHEPELRRAGYDTNVAYCRKTKDMPYESEVCYDPTKIQVNPQPIGKLGECQVDCDTDSDCGFGLLCADEHENDLIKAGLDPNTAYCNLSAGSIPYDSEVCYDPNKVVAGPKKLGKCGYSCFFDSDCGEGLLCAFEHRAELIQAGHDGRTANCFFAFPPPLAASVCYDPRDIRKLGECQHTCRSDSDCSSGLLCTYQHKFFLAQNGYDDHRAHCAFAPANDEVCFDPQKIIARPPAKLRVCQQECFFDSQCADGLLCARQHRALLTKYGFDEHTAHCSFLQAGYDACFDPLRIEPPSGKLGACEFDCDTDDDCAPGLLCADEHEDDLKRVGLDTNTAYCRFTGLASIPYEAEVCYDPRLATGPVLRGKAKGGKN